MADDFYSNVAILNIASSRTAGIWISLTGGG